MNLKNMHRQTNLYWEMLGITQNLLDSPPAEVATPRLGHYMVPLPALWTTLAYTKTETDNQYFNKL